MVPASPSTDSLILAFITAPGASVRSSASLTNDNLNGATRAEKKSKHSQVN